MALLYIRDLAYVKKINLAKFIEDWPKQIVMLKQTQKHGQIKDNTKWTKIDHIHITKCRIKQFIYINEGKSSVNLPQSS